MKNLLLILGLIISLISIGFNVFVFGFHNELILNKEEELNSINFTNLYLSTEFNHAENIYFKSRYLEYEIVNMNNNKRSQIDTKTLKMIQEDLGMLRFKSVNYALNSSIDFTKPIYNQSEFNELMEYLKELNRVKKLDSIRLNKLRSKYIEYYIRHEKYIKKNMDKKIELRSEVKKLKQKNSWMKFLAISFQTIGLILVFLKDIKK